jgi:uncharacterized membrane protein
LPGGGRIAVRHNEKNLMVNHTDMNHADGWMHGWMGGGMWLWTVIGVVVLILLIVVIAKLSGK